MWADVVIDAVGLLWPFGRDKPVEQTAVQPGASTVRVELNVPGEFARRLNESDWLSEEVLAADMVRQGKPYSLFKLVTGLVLIDVIRRPSKTLPRQFVLALTAERVIAYALSIVSEGDEYDTTAVKMKRGERGSWPRDLVRVIDQTKGSFGSKGATLELGGVERVPVAWDSDDSTDELVELLNR